MGVLSAARWACPFDGGDRLHEIYRDRTAVSCFQLRGMQKYLRNFVNRMQLYNNNSSDIWKSRIGCEIVRGRRYTLDPAIARANGVWNPNIGGFIGWLMTEDWLVPVAHVAYLDKAKNDPFIPLGLG